jgi:hypothetical protein
MVTADFNGDGKPDLAVGGQILLGAGGGRFQTGVPFSGGSAGQPYVGLATGDLNGDGKADLAVNDGGSGALVYLGKRRWHVSAEPGGSERWHRHVLRSHRRFQQRP